MGQQAYCNWVCLNCCSGSATLEKLSSCCLVHFLVNSRLNDVDPKNDFAPQELMKSTTWSLSSDHFPFLCINPLQASAIRSKVISALKIIIPQSVFIEFLIQLMTSYLLHCYELDTALLNNDNAISNWKLLVLLLFPYCTWYPLFWLWKQYNSRSLLKSFIFKKSKYLSKITKFNKLSTWSQIVLFPQAILIL